MSDKGGSHEDGDSEATHHGKEGTLIPINNINEKFIFKMPTRSLNQSGNPYCLNS